MANHLENFLCLLDEAGMVDRFCELDVTEMARTLRHVLRARLALELSVDRAEERVVETTVAWLHSALIHRLRVEDMRDTHVFDLLRRQETELDLLDRLERRTGVREVEVRHDVGLCLTVGS